MAVDKLLAFTWLLMSSSTAARALGKSITAKARSPHSAFRCWAICENVL